MTQPTLVAIVLLGACVPALAQAEATATFMDADSNEVGTATLTQIEDGGVSIIGEITGMGAGDHGFHVHETGDCDPSTGFDSAGGHFNPSGAVHGIANPEGPHAGDIVSNVVAGDDGVVELEVIAEMISLLDDDEGYVFDADGSALVIHADPDDQTTDPAGNAGERVACAVMEAAPAL